MTHQPKNSLFLRSRISLVFILLFAFSFSPGISLAQREGYLQIFGNIRMGGIRLTELADRAQLSLAATSELVNDLEQLGYLTRRPDPADGRAKLIDLSERGRDLMANAGERVADIERRWSDLVGQKNFTAMAGTMQRLLDELDPKESRG